MINLDASKVAPQISTLLLHRGAGLPPLVWHERQIPLAKETLDQTEDAKLFGRVAITDEGMVPAVRAMLYLWNGWPDDCRMFAQALDDAERHFITGICDRQAGDAAAAKTSFQQIEEHAVYRPLSDYAAKAIGVGADANLTRFARIVELTEIWEPFAFVDLFGQARAGKLCRAAEEVVCAIQCREFELLFNHCYQGATGRTAEADQQRNEPERPKRNPRPPPRPTRRPARATRKPERPEKAKPSELPKRPGLTAIPSNAIGVLCPICQKMKMVPKNARGQTVQCDKCSTAFKVPLSQAGTGAPTSK